MFIPPDKIKDVFDRDARTLSDVQLKSSHLLIEHELAFQLFGNDLNVQVIYYAARKILMLAPASDVLFKNLHKANLQMLKNRNLAGEKTVAIHELLIDNDIDDSDRPLNYEMTPGSGILVVKF